MNFFDIFGFCVSVLQMYGGVVCLRGLLPCQIIPRVSAKLDDAQDTVTRAVKAGAIPHISKYEEDLERYRIHALLSSKTFSLSLYTASLASLR